MKSAQRIEALLLVKGQLEAWLTYQPNWHLKLHGNADANVAYQQLKTLIQYEMNNLVLDNPLDVEVFFEGDTSILDESLGLYNDK